MTEEDDSWVKVANTKNTTYTDKDWLAEEETEIKYVVRAYKKVKSSKKWSKNSNVITWTTPQWVMSSVEVYQLLGECLEKYGEVFGTKYLYKQNYDTYSVGVWYEPGNVLYFELTDYYNQTFTSMDFYKGGRVSVGTMYFVDVNQAAENGNLLSQIAYDIKPETYTDRSVVPKDHDYVQYDSSRSEIIDADISRGSVSNLIEYGIKPILSDFFGIKLHNIGFVSWGD